MLQVAYVMVVVLECLGHVGLLDISWPHVVNILRDTSRDSYGSSMGMGVPLLGVVVISLEIPQAVVKGTSLGRSLVK